MSAGGAEHELVTVRLRLRVTPGADLATSAADILHHDLLAEDFSKPWREHPSKAVTSPSSRKRNDHGDRPGGPFLGACACACTRQPVPEYRILGSQSAMSGTRISNATRTKSATRNGSVPR